VLVAPPPARELEWNRAAGIVTTLGALSVLLLLFEGSPRPPREVGPVVLRGSFEVSLVDDESNPFEAEAAGLPSGVAILREEVPTRSVRYPTVARSFVRLVLQSGETLEQARRRVAPWLAARPVPPDRRLVWGEVHDDEGESFRSDRDTRIVDKISAFRTYLLVGDPILTIADLESATLNRDADHRYFVGLHLKPAGAERFWAATARHRQERIAILVGGVVRFVPTIESEIGGGYVQISMGEGEPELTKARAERLYRELRGSAP
jgi:hypothetical protein